MSFWPTCLLLQLVGTPPIEAAIEAPTTFFSDPRLLLAWDPEAGGPLSLARVLDQLHEDRQLPRPPGGGAGPSSGALLNKYEASWGAIADVFDRDLARIVGELDLDWEKDITKTYEVSAAKTPLGRDKWHRGNGNVVRIFQERWLRSPDGQLLLSGVVYRPDRADFDPGSCGELRLLYRLAYQVTMKEKVYASRLPFTVNLVFRVPAVAEGGCRAFAEQWRAPALTDDNAAALAAELLKGPVDLAAVRFQQLELNAQIARFPSDLENVERRRFAGQAIYWMRIFTLRGDRFLPIKLENTPDIQAIRRDPALQAVLRKAIAESLPGIDRGVFSLPESLLADVAISYSTLGSARRANRPFDTLLSRAEADQLLKGGALPHPQFLASGATLLERLNGATCMGCHQSASTAGFHFLGVDRDFGGDQAAVRQATDGNRLQLPFSPHFYAEAERRQQYRDAFARGAEPVRLRPHPAAPKARWSAQGPQYQAAGSNAPCLLPEQDLGPAARWVCAPGLRCQALVTNPDAAFTLGSCLPPEAQLRAGGACRADHLTEAPAAASAQAPLFAANVRAYQDRVRSETAVYPIPEGKLSATEYNCRPSKIGVPLGRITRQCQAAERSLAAIGPDAEELCAVVGGKGFEEMARGYFDSERFARGVGRGLLDACGPSRFCREDYICQQLPDFLANRRHGVPRPVLERLQGAQLGFCTPTYFVYQLRLDGHPNPR